MKQIRTYALAAIAMLAGIASLPVSAQEDRLAACPDPEAARKDVRDCLQQNPYNTREVCEERTLEKLCAKK